MSRMSISFTDRADAALERLIERTGMSKAEIANRAILALDLIERAQGEGGAMWTSTDLAGEDLTRIFLI